MKLFDRYTFVARFLPAAAILLPGGLAVACWLPTPGDLVSKAQLLPLAASAAGGMLLAQLGRGPGKSKEPSLFAMWGGKPSTAMLRHSDPRIDRHTKARYHLKLSRLVLTSPAPTPEQEMGDPAAADAVYASWVTYLLAHTRDLEQFRVLFSANIDYGYRRNLWGMKPAGVLVTALAAVAALTRVVWSYWSAATLDWAAVLVLVISVWFLVVWLLTITTNWVKIPAETYATQLLAAADLLESADAGARETARRVS